MICIITVDLKNYMIIGILVHLKGSSAHWIHVVYTNTSMVQQQGLIDSKGEEGM